MSTITLMGCARRDCRRLERRRPRPGWFVRGSMKNLFSAVAFVVTVAGIEAASAQPFPSRPITIIVPFAAGGGTDVTARILGEHMSRTLGQRIVIENIAGAGGTTGSIRAMRSNPDGYTILMGNMGTHSTAVTLYPNLDYRPAIDFAPIGLVHWAPVMMVARKDFPPESPKELVSYLKANAQKLNMAHAGVGSIGFSCGLLFNSIVGVTPTLVPFNGAAPGLNALISGQVDYMCDGGALNSVPHEQSGRIKAYMIDAERRSLLLPNVPTAKEAGMPEFKTSAWTALFAPRETPQSVLDKLTEALDRALDDDQTRKRMLDNATEIPDKADRGQQQLGILVKSEIDRWRQIIETAVVNAR
jgi:tripartite-type tricarboxylate transporter receptor subunit TctC